MKTISLLLATLLLCACSTHYPNRNPVNEVFPTVTGNNLQQETIELPSHLKGEQALLLLGYKQNSQFDIDRWLIGLDMTNTKVKVYEIPTIQGFLPKLFSEQIDNGMRKGIPSALWKIVITVYENGDLIQAFTGNENPNNARVVLLDEKGNVHYFYDQGFSVDALNTLRKALI